jgi:hypothetical protein
MEIHEMAIDFCNRMGGRFTPEEVLEHGKNNIPYADEDGFFILSLGNNTLYLDYLYVVPGRGHGVLQRYFHLIDEKMLEYGVRYLQTIARRSGVEKLYPDVLRPVATVYEFDRGGVPNGWRFDAKHQPDNQTEQVDGSE